MRLDCTHLLTRLHLTGGRGRLASLLAGDCRIRGHEVTLYSRTAGDGYRGWDELLAQRFGRDDVVVHLAWSTLPATAEAAAGREFRDDLPRLEQMLENWTRRAPEQRPHLIFFSSGGAVYGNAGAAPSREDDVCRPMGAYGRAKLAAEKIIERFVAEHDLRSTVLRVSNPYGYLLPESRPQGLISHAIARALDGGELAVLGDGSARKDFIHHTDFLRAMDAIFMQRPRGTFNLCTGESKSVNEVIGLIERLMDRRIARRFAPAAAWDVSQSRLDGTRLREAIGWHPLLTIEEGIGHAIRTAEEEAGANHCSSVEATKP